MTNTTISPEEELFDREIKRPRLVNWVWRPWYARVWWSLIAAYWTVGVGAFVFQPLADFYASRLACFLNIAFYPVFAFMFLSIGWVIAWKDAVDYVAEHPEIENTLGWEWQPYDFEGESERRRRLNDPSNPDSPSYIANASLRRLFDR